MSISGGENPKLREAVEKSRQQHAETARRLGAEPNTRAIEKVVRDGVRELAKEGK